MGNSWARRMEVHRAQKAVTEVKKKTIKNLITLKGVKRIICLTKQNQPEDKFS